LRPNEDHDRLVIGVVKATLGAKHLKNHPSQTEAGSDDWVGHWNRRRLHLVHDLVPVGIGVVLARFPKLVDRQSLCQSHQPGDVVVMGVGGNDQSETFDPILIKRLPQQARIGSAVDKNGLSTGGEEQCRVSLTNIDKDDGRPTGYARHDRHRHYR
jgi:hypothetical protein